MKDRYRQDFKHSKSKGKQIQIERGFPIQPVMPSDNAVVQERNYYLKQMENLRKGFRVVIKNALAEAKAKISKIVENQFKRSMYVFNQETKKLLQQFYKLDKLLGK